MNHWYTRGSRLLQRTRRRTDLANLEQLESRALLAFSSLGFSLPDLTITGHAGPRAAWGGVLDVSAFLQNIGASTITEPLSQAPAAQPPVPGSPFGSTSTADAPDTTVAVLASRSSRSLRAQFPSERSRLRRFHRIAWKNSRLRSRYRRAQGLRRSRREVLRVVRCQFIEQHARGDARQ